MSQSTPLSENSIVNFLNVDFSHPNGTAALRNINLEIRRGELLAILGSNGAGKTTLVKHINGLLKATHGVVKVFGENAKLSSTAKLSRRVGIVFQNPNNQLFEQTVKKEIQFALRNFGFAEPLIDTQVALALDTFSLSEYSERPPMELSGGEKKRLCIALVLAWDPDIFILDEPTVGQDSEQKTKLVQIIDTLRSQGKTVIIVTHDIEFVWPLQPRVVVMSEGRIIADGKCQDVLSDDAVMSSGSVLPPQLVVFSKLMGWNPPFPADTEEAKGLVEKEIRSTNL
ncbi:MAG: ABC transporter ATP-binding protein [Nitrososphaerota archaeon]|nr:ABC transporter ATP-binding protein [Nitrososphaerota archaeon]